MSIIITTPVCSPALHHTSQYVELLGCVQEDKVKDKVRCCVKSYQHAPQDIDKRIIRQLADYFQV